MPVNKQRERGDMLLIEMGYDERLHTSLLLRIAADKPPIWRACERLVAAYEAIYGCGASDINYGMCEDFAADLVRIMEPQEAEFLWGDIIARYRGYEDPESFHSHCLTVFNGKYYDSECPSGVECLHQIPFFKREGLCCASCEFCSGGPGNPSALSPTVGTVVISDGA